MRSVAALVLVLSACAHSSGAVKDPEGPINELSGLTPFIVEGEQITWEVKVLGIEGGRARMATGTVGTIDGRRVVAAVFEVSPRASSPP